MTASPAALAVQPDGAGRFAVTVDPGWSIGGKPHGGYLMALTLRAAVTASPHPDPLALSTVFLRPPSFGPAQVHVEELRAGRSVAMHRARLVEGDTTVLEMLVTSGRAPAATPDYVAAPPPDLPPVDDCPRAGATAPDGTSLALMDAVELRVDPRTMGWAVGRPGPHQPALRGWMRIPGTVTDPYAVVIAADALPPTVFALGARGWAPTVEMTTLLRGVPENGWLRVAVHTTLVADGWFDEDVVVWDAAGNVVGQARQLAMTNKFTT